LSSNPSKAKSKTKNPPKTDHKDNTTDKWVHIASGEQKVCHRVNLLNYLVDKSCNFGFHSIIKCLESEVLSLGYEQPSDEEPSVGKDVLSAVK
jgi:hypothetical protein